MSSTGVVSTQTFGLVKPATSVASIITASLLGVSSCKVADPPETKSVFTNPKTTAITSPVTVKTTCSSVAPVVAAANVHLDTKRNAPFEVISLWLPSLSKAISLNTDIIHLLYLVTIHLFHHR